MRFYVSHKVGKNARIGTSFGKKDFEGCGYILIFPFILCYYLVYYCFVWPINKIIELVKRKCANSLQPETLQTARATPDSVPDSAEKQPFYKTAWFFAVVSFFFPVLGLLMLFTWHKNWDKSIKVGVAVALALWTIITIPACFGGNSTTMTSGTDAPSKLIVTATDYSTVSKTDISSVDAPAKTIPTEQTTTTTETTTTTTTTTTQVATTTTKYVEMVWISDSGHKYHSYSSCSNMSNPRQVTVEQAKNWGYTPCKRCH